MQIEQVTLATCGAAAGAVVVIDVLRAFTTAAFAFAAGAREIVLVSTVDEALALRERLPGALAMGEVGGLAVAGFDFSNSPADLVGQDLGGRTLIQRTSAGTQGVVRSVSAELLLASSFVCAGATARYLRELAPERVAFVITGDYGSAGGAGDLGRGGYPIDMRADGDEDAACADYLAALLRADSPDPAPYLRRVRESTPGRAFADPARPEFPSEDLDYCADLDRFDFAMLVERRDGLLVMRVA